MQALPPGRKTSLIGGTAGLIVGSALFVALFALVPEPAAGEATAERLAFALRLAAVPAALLLLMTMAIGLQRLFDTAAANPLAGQESEPMRVDIRVLTNTLEQTVVFVLAGLSLAALPGSGHLRALIALTGLFVVARIAFWVGYRLHPLLRAPGMAATFAVNGSTLAYVLSRVFAGA